MVAYRRRVANLERELRRECIRATGRLRMPSSCAVSAQVRIGTSGWHYKHWCGPFYEEKLSPLKMLDFYFQHFDTVEINNSFYRLPGAETFRCWRESTPRG